MLKTLNSNCVWFLTSDYEVCLCLWMCCNSVNTSCTLHRVILKALHFYSLIIYMIFSQSTLSILYDDIINSQTESSNTSIKSSLKSSSSLKFIDFWRHLVQYLEHDDSVRKNELQSEFKEWWILINYEWKNTDDS